jgi:hypothetical protein
MTRLRADQPTQPIKALSIKRETREERLRRLKQTADATGRHFLHIYLEDEKRQEYYSKSRVREGRSSYE